MNTNKMSVDQQLTKFRIFKDACMSDNICLINEMINDLRCPNNNILISMLNDLQGCDCPIFHSRLMKYLELLLEHGYDPCEVFKFKLMNTYDCPIFYAVEHCSDDIVFVMLKYIRTSIPILNGETILMLAVRRRKFSNDNLLNKLLKLCDINYVNYEKFSVFNMAVKDGDIHSIKYVSKKFNGQLTNKENIVDCFMKYVSSYENTKYKFDRIITMMYALIKPGRFTNDEFANMIGKWLASQATYIKYLFISYEARNSDKKEDRLFGHYAALRKRGKLMSDKIVIGPLTDDDYSELFKLFAHRENVIFDVMRYSDQPTEETLKKFIEHVPDINSISSNIYSPVPYFFHAVNCPKLLAIMIKNSKINLDMTAKINHQMMSILDYAFIVHYDKNRSISERRAKEFGNLINLLRKFNLKYDRTNQTLHNFIQASTQHLQVDNLIVNGLFNNEYQFANDCFIHQCTSGNLEAVKAILKVAKRMKAIKK